MKIGQGLVVQKGEPRSCGVGVRAGTRRALQPCHVTATVLFKGLIYVFIYYKGHVFAVGGRTLTGLARSKQQAAVSLPASLALLILQCSAARSPNHPHWLRERLPSPPFASPLPLRVCVNWYDESISQGDEFMSMFIPLAGGRTSCLPRSLLCSLSANTKCHPFKSSREAKVSSAAWLCPRTERVGRGSRGAAPSPAICRSIQPWGSTLYFI